MQEFFTYLKQLKGPLSIIIALFLLLYLFTNPNKSDYIAWAIKTSKAEIAGTSVNNEQMLKLFKNPTLDQNTSSQSFVFFTVFRSKIGEDKLITIGICKGFIPLI